MNLFTWHNPPNLKNKFYLGLYAKVEIMWWLLLYKELTLFHQKVLHPSPISQYPFPSKRASMASSKLVDVHVEEEETVTLEASQIPNQLQTPKKCLIGKLFSDKPQVHATITAVLYGMWENQRDLSVKK